MPDVPFPLRVLLLIIVLAVAAGIDRWRKGAKSNRWREYGLLLGAAFVGGTFAALNDQLSLWLSPEYFELGKGIQRGEGFRYDVTELGFHAGFLAGAIAAGLLLIANNPKTDRPSLPLRRLLPAVPTVLLPAILFGAAGALLWPALAPAATLADQLPSGRIAPFRQVHGLHAGLYLGAIGGLAAAVWRVRRERRGLGPASGDPV